MLDPLDSPCSRAGSSPGAGSEVAAPVKVEGALAGPLLQALLDELDEGFVVCDADLRPVLANHAARTELGRRDPLGLEDARLTVIDPEGALRLGSTARDVATGGRRRLLVLPGTAGPLFVVVRPMWRDAQPSGLVLVSIGRRVLCKEPAVDLLAEAYDLTASERRVLGGLLEGLNPSGIAAAKRVGLCTVRSQISAIRGKLGTASIAGLLRLAARIPAAAAPQRSPAAALHRGARAASMATARAPRIASPIAGPVAPRAAAPAATAAVSTACAAASAALSRAAGR